MASSVHFCHLISNHTQYDGHFVPDVNVVSTCRKRPLVGSDRRQTSDVGCKKKELSGDGLYWSGNILQVREEQLHPRALFAQPCAESKPPRGKQCMSWQRSMKTLTSKLSG
ncbi:hypothetical protein T265_10742 [Opisthorchis viverrini]|uniref:Uncharacterized protein n=1 Tax=Opisthorchis viverrini TaxID=6198 RepID=A0A075A048_OPIVI|nr:hypothetical protein T265_10742 [Opisthorchis viverrini]KER20784.1 hypothetical protein T265_10742 [Opisthorchis viverrini]